MRLTNICQVYIYDTNIGAGLTPARVDENAVERIFVDLLKRSNMITQVNLLILS